MVAKSMTLDHHLLLENSAEFLRFVDGEVIVPAGGICEGVYWVIFYFFVIILLILFFSPVVPSISS